MRAKSLRRELLGWLVLPLAAVVSLNLWTTYNNALDTADLITERTAEGIRDSFRCTRLYGFTIFRALHILMRETRFLRQLVDRPTQVNTIVTQCCHLLRTILKK